MLFNRRRASSIARHLLAAILATTTISACTAFIHETLEVDSAAVDNARKIGAVVLHTKSEYTYKNSTQIDEILVMDVGASDSEEAAVEARARLLRQGWAELGAGLVESRKWRHIIVSFDSLDGLEAYGATLKAEIEGAVRAASMEADKLVIVDLAPME
ncbi:hypothetical protein GCM10022419_006050 [Nonomuraea rosea]|uniref:DUF541 domain-containing protein n=1 Tax=Nonomuraea rosea TaxID=638574 RepID=A0ABP6VAC1_9ACTN